MRIVSWNVNGLRALVKKGVLLKFLDNSKADIVTLQETRVNQAQLPSEVRKLKGWHTYFAAAERLGYSGVAIFSRKPADKVIDTLPEPRFNVEGRFLVAKFGRMSVASIYFPNGAGKERDNSRVPYKLDFYEAARHQLERLRKAGPVYVTGDFNTAHTEIDLARPKSNEKTSGFLPIEREALDLWLQKGWIDTFRKRHPKQSGHYTWWRQWGGSRENNVGWRIDYVLASPTADKRVSSAFIWPDIKGSDHCPIGVDVKVD
ncbi:MAG: exodeoxyribonuclease III [Gammaproteobacteria bacterium]|nr:exodeoxyribonuclease III [Gammaproteobacteria bacterium]MYF37458.1 exodeoxyribonuclease III [Gammaproteobacteria bacterium]